MEAVQGVPGVAVQKYLANTVVARVVALGSRTVEMSGTLVLIIPGPKVSRLATVSCGEAGFC